MNRLFRAEMGLSQAQVRQLLGGAMISFFTFLMFGGALGWEGLMVVAWESGLLPGIPDIPFPNTISDVSLAFTVITLIGAPSMLATAGLVKESAFSRKIGRPGIEDVPVFVFYVLLYVVTVYVSSIELTFANIVSGAVAMGVLLLYSSTPFYVIEDPDVPNEVRDPVDGIVVLIAAFVFVSMVSLGGLYGLAAVEILNL